MANAAVNVSFLENSRGGRTLVHNDFMYRLKTQKGERSYWYCVQPTCPARINLLHDIPTKISMNHNHDNNPTGTKVISVMNSIRKRVRESTESVQAIYEDLLCSARSTEWDNTTEVVKNIPTFYSSRSSLYRHRSKLHPALPNTRDEIVLDGEWKETLTGEKFLLADDTVDERILIFATEDNLTELSYADVWYMDGTFYSSPNCFYQLYTIHAQINEQMYPLVNGFLPNKTRATYRRFFSSLQTAADNQNIHLLPDIIMMDFEKPAQTTATEVFSSTTIRGCFFHVTQCIWRKVQSLGLVREFKENDDVRTLVRRAAVLPLVPLRQVEDMWLFAIENCEDDSQQIEAFKDYVTEQWVEGDKSLWNHYDNRGPRTTNHVGNLVRVNLRKAASFSFKLHPLS